MCCNTQGFEGMLMDKINVNGKDASPVYNFLKVRAAAHAVTRNRRQARISARAKAPALSVHQEWSGPAGLRRLCHFHSCRFRAARQGA